MRTLFYPRAASPAFILRQFCNEGVHWELLKKYAAEAFPDDFYPTEGAALSGGEDRNTNFIAQQRKSYARDFKTA